MTIAVLDAQPQTPSARALMERALDPYILLGMPHLTPAGLSETWLMKELGHRHWLMLARHLGMDNADFRTADGREVYASICATSLTGAKLRLARANDVLAIRSSLYRISRAQYSSRHHLSIGGRDIADVELISAFVRRNIEGDNRSLVRVEHARSKGDMLATSELAATAAALRRGTAETHLGMAPAVGRHLKSFRFKPSTTEEFNGAGLFYFAEFQAVMTRALEAWFPKQRLEVLRRDVFLKGNIRGEDAVILELSAVKPDDTGIACRLLRSDGTEIAALFALLRDS